MDDASAFIVRAALVLHRRLDVLGQRFSAGVELPRAPADSLARGRQTKARITALAEPAEIFRRVVLFVAVAVIRDQEAGRSAKSTTSRPRRNALPGAVTVRPISDSVGGLAPAVAARGGDYSSPSPSSSPSSSSGGATMSATSSS